MYEYRLMALIRTKISTAQTSSTYTVPLLWHLTAANPGNTQNHGIYLKAEIGLIPRRLLPGTGEWTQSCTENQQYHKKNQRRKTNNHRKAHSHQETTLNPDNPRKPLVYYCLKSYQKAETLGRKRGFPLLELRKQSLKPENRKFIQINVLFDATKKPAFVKKNCDGSQIPLRQPFQQVNVRVHMKWSRHSISRFASAVLNKISLGLPTDN